MSWTFVLVAVAMLAAAGAMVAWPLLRGAGRRGRRLEAVNRDIYRERLAELDSERDAGLLSEAEIAAARVELERNLLADVDEVGTEPRQPARQGAHVLMAAALAAVVPALGLGIYLYLHEPHSAVGGAERQGMVAGDVPAGHEPGELERMVEGLAARLRSQPEDVEGWMMLGRSYVFLERYDDAVAAYASAHRRAEVHPRLLVEYAEALAMAAGSRVAGRPAELARRALALAPDEPGALWLVGAGAYEIGDYDDALRHWRRLLAVLPAGGETAAVVAERVADAESLAGLDGAGGAAIRVDLTLDEALAGRADPEDVVLVYARAMGGSPAPLAIARRQVKELPLRLWLDESMAMVEGVSLAGSETVEVVARVTRTGTAAPQSGDLQGRAGPVMAGDAVRVVIDEVVP